MALARTVNTPTPRIASKGKDPVSVKVLNTSSIRNSTSPQLLDLDKFFMMKKGSIGDPGIYLGAKLRKVQLDNGVLDWGMNPAKYVQEALRDWHWQGLSIPQHQG